MPSRWPILMMLLSPDYLQNALPANIMNIWTCRLNFWYINFREHTQIIVLAYISMPKDFYNAIASACIFSFSRFIYLKTRVTGAERSERRLWFAGTPKKWPQWSDQFEPKRRSAQNSVQISNTGGRKSMPSSAPSRHINRETGQRQSSWRSNSHSHIGSATS